MPLGMARWRTSGTLVNFLPVDVWRTVALMAAPEGYLAMWVMCFLSRAGLVAIGARIHHVRGHLIPTEKVVAFDEEYYPWEKTAMGHQAREERFQRIGSMPLLVGSNGRSAPRGKSLAIVSWSIGRHPRGRVASTGVTPGTSGELFSLPWWTRKSTGRPAGEGVR